MAPAGPARVVVVGASLAGLRAAEAVRKSGYVGELVVVGDEPHMPYNRPPLLKHRLSTDPSAEPVTAEWLRPNHSAADVQWRLGEAVAAADLRARTVTVSGGDVLSWDGLVVASGLRPRRLNLPGPNAGRYVVRTLDDAAALRSAVGSSSALVIIGAGFIGCEVAALAASHGIPTHVIAPESVPIERPLGTLVGGEVRRRLEALGVHFHLGTIPTGFGGEASITSVTLSNGMSLAADAVVEAVGSVPNVEWLAGNGLDLSDGVLCDENLRVEGRPDIVAGGDVARFPNALVDTTPRRVEHWMTAVDTAKRAGQVLAAYLLRKDLPNAPFAPMLSFWSHQHQIRIQSFGSPGVGGDDIRILEGDLAGEVAIGYYRGRDIVGVVLFGLAGRYAHYRQTIESARVRPVAHG